MSKKLQGKLTISRVHNSHEGDYVEIRVVDEASGCEVVSVECSILDFGNAVLNLAFQPCRFELRPANAGNKREMREITVPCPPFNTYGEETEEDGLQWIIKHAAGELMDGWRPRSPAEVFKARQRRGKDEVGVTLIRFVEAK